MKIERIELHHISQQLVHPFRTSFGTQVERSVSWWRFTVRDWWAGESALRPGIPATRMKQSTRPGISCVISWFRPMLVRRSIHRPMSRLVLARCGGTRWPRPVWRTRFGICWPKPGGVPLSESLGGVRDRVEVGVSIGIQPTLDGLLERVSQFVDKGYRRIKMKIEPGWEIEPLTAVREQHPDIKLMADANSAFTLEHVEIFQQMDPLNLIMIEQPLHYDDIFDHAKLQAQVNTPICLDESIHSPNHARWQLSSRHAASLI